jgi:hypothetical protein
MPWAERCIVIEYYFAPLTIMLGRLILIVPAQSQGYDRALSTQQEMMLIRSHSQADDQPLAPNDGFFSELFTRGFNLEDEIRRAAAG